MRKDRLHGGLFGLKIGDTQFNSGTEAQIGLGGKRGLAPIPACQPNNRASPGRRDRKEARSNSLLEGIGFEPSGLALRWVAAGGLDIATHLALSIRWASA